MAASTKVEFRNRSAAEKTIAGEQSETIRKYFQLCGKLLLVLLILPFW
jgi:hypothetical protein